MRAILVVLGIAIFGIVLSSLFSKPKDLTPYPQEREDQRKQAMNDSSNQAQATSNTSSEPAFNPPKEGAVRATMTVENRGDFTFEFYPKAAPKTVAQITGLIGKGFYNGVRVHRVEPGFVVQFGDPQTKTMDVKAREIGTGGSGKDIPFETNELKNVTGAVSMALSSARSDTADSQMFINLKHNAFLDGDYCVFGKLVEGMDKVTTIQVGDKIASFKLQ